MSDFNEVDAYHPVTLVDRTGNGGCEITHNGVRVVFKTGQAKRAVPSFLAEWLFIHGKHMVWSEDGEYTHRFGIEDAPEDMLASLGPEAGDCSPITVDGNRLEGWDTTAVDRDAKSTRVVPIGVPASAMRERQATGAEYQFGPRKE